MLKPLVIYHADCADGFGAAFAAWLKLGDEAEYVPMQYGKKVEQWDHTCCYGRETYILDFSLPKPKMDDLFRHTKYVIWLDHHASAFKDHGFTPNAPGEPAIAPLTKHHIILDNNKSGAYLAWEYFHPGTEVPMLSKHIDDYDRWQFKIEGTKAFNKALWSYAPWSFEQWDEFYTRESYPESEAGSLPTSFISEGAAILRAHDQNVQSVVKGSAREIIISVVAGSEIRDMKYPATEWMKYPGLAANCPPHLTSDVGHELADKSGTFGLCWALSQEGYLAKCSLRSNGEYDVSAIAKAFGGGGHRNAARFEVHLATLIGWLSS